MELNRFKGNPILTANKNNKWEAGAVFNPSVISHKDDFHMLYRAVASGFSPLLNGGYENFISSIGYAKSKNGIWFQRDSEPIIKPESSFERFGCEDPRVTEFEDKFYILYTMKRFEPYTSTSVTSNIGLAVTENFREVDKYGMIGPMLNTKAAALFPEEINGKVSMVLTLQPDTPHSSIAITSFEDVDQLLRRPLFYWDNFFSSIDDNIVLSPSKDAYRGPEVGVPPLKTRDGWLLIYCGESQKKEWSISAALLDLKNPTDVIAHSKKPILEPKEKYEVEGLIPNVAFPTGAVLVEDKLSVYYGAADTTCCLATCSLEDLLDSLI